MRWTRTVLVMAAGLAVALAASRAWAVEGEGPPMKSGKGGRKGLPPPPPFVLMKALDADGDGVISAEEIANAPAALKALDKNGDGKLTPDELRPPRRPPDGKGDKGGPPPKEEGGQTGEGGPPRKGGPPDKGGPGGAEGGRPAGPPPDQK